MEAEEGQMGDDYKVLAKIVPAVLGALTASFIVLSLKSGNLEVLALGGVGLVIAASSRLLLLYLDRSIRASKKRIRKQCEQIWARYRKLGNIVGIEPALAPEVGKALDEAAGIYMKHEPNLAKGKDLSSPQARGALALEEALAKILELAEPENVRAQELSLSAGWAQPLLNEMSVMDGSLERYAQIGAMNRITPNDPLANLREARLELQGIEAAASELEQGHTS